MKHKYKCSNCKRERTTNEKKVLVMCGCGCEMEEIKEVCKYCKLKIDWFKDSLNVEWFGCECYATLTEEEYYIKLKGGLKEK